MSHRKGRHCSRGERDSSYWLCTNRCGWKRTCSGLIVCWLDQWSPRFPPVPWICETDFLKKLEYNCFTMLCWLLPCNKNQLYVYIDCLPPEPPSHPHPTPLGHYRAPNWAPCAIGQFPTSYLFAHGSVYMSLLLSQFVTPSPSPNLCTEIDF